LSAVPLNSTTINGGAYPLPVSKYPIQENIINRNGWYHISTNKGASKWTIYPRGNDGSTKIPISGINQIYFTITFNKLTPSYLVPSITLFYGAAGNYLTLSYSGTALKSGTYTVVMNFNTIFGQTNILNTNYNNTVGSIITFSPDTPNSSPTNIPTKSSTVDSISLNQLNTFYNANNVIVCGGNVILQSTDCGATYTAYSALATGINTNINLNCNKIFYNTPSPLYMVVGGQTTGGTGGIPGIYYSTSGSSYTGINVGSSSDNYKFNAIENNNAYNLFTGTEIVYLCGGQTNGGTTVPLYYSSSPTASWTNITTSTLKQTDIINVITYNYGINQFMLGLNFVSSTNCTLAYCSYTAPSTFTITLDITTGGSTGIFGGGTSAVIRDIRSNFNNNMFVAVGRNHAGTNTIMYSTTGASNSWTAVSPNPISSSGICGAFNGTMWLAGGGDGTTISNNSFAYSYDGTTWTSLPYTANVNPFTTVTDIRWNGLTWVACGTGEFKLAYSYSGLTWIGIKNASIPASLTSVGNLYPNNYQFMISSLYFETKEGANIAPGTTQYMFNSGDVDNNYQYNVLNTLISNLYKSDLYTYANPLNIISN